MRDKLWIQTIFLCCFLFVCFGHAFAQTKIRKPIKLELLQPDKKTPLAYFALAVTFGQDTLKSLNLLSDHTGNALLEIPEGANEFRIRSSSKVLKIDTLLNISTVRTNSTITCITQYMENQLSEIDISAGRSTLHSSDKISYKATDFKVPEQPIVKNLLLMIPSISKIDNNYKIDGNFDPVFYINGTRVLYLAVENLPLASIDRVEIIKNASMTSGLKSNQVALNIVTKKTPQTTIGGLISANNSFTQHNFGGFSTLYLTGKKFFINLMLNSYSAEYDVSSQSYWTDKSDGRLLYARSMEGRSATIPKIATLSANYDINEKTQFNYSLSYNNIRAAQDVTSLITLRNNNSSNEYLNSLFRPLTITNFANLNLKLTKESNLFFRVTHNFSKTLINLDLENQRSGLINNSSENKIQDFNLLIGHDFKIAKAAIEFGGLFQLNENSNTFEFSSSQFLPAEGLLEYNQEFYALYLKLKYPFKYFTITLTNRLDLNHSVLNGLSLGSRLQYLPSLAIYLPTKENGIFSLSASRQTVFPGSDDLAENQRRQTLGIISAGSQNVGQQVNWNVSLNHSLSGKQLELTSTLNYEYTQGLIAYSPYLTDGENILRTKINVNRESVISFRPSLNINFNKRISLTGAALMGFYRSNAVYTGYQLDNSGFFVSPSFNLVQSNPKFVNLNLALSYRNRIYSPFEIKGQKAPALSLSISRAFLKKSLTVTTSIYDALNTSNNSSTSGLSPSLNYNTTLFQPMRSIGVSLSYLFNAKAFRYGGSNKGIKGRETKAPSSN